MKSIILSAFIILTTILQTSAQRVYKFDRILVVEKGQDNFSFDYKKKEVVTLGRIEFYQDKIVIVIQDNTGKYIENEYHIKKMINQNAYRLNKASILEVLPISFKLSNNNRTLYFYSEQN